MANFYKIEIKSTEWEVPDVYQELELLAKGSYGQVCKALIPITNQQVAIKKMRHIFDSEFDAQYAYREIRLLKHLNHDNVLRLLDIFEPHGNLEEFDDIYIVTDLVANDLERLMCDEEISEERIRFFVFQMLRGLQYIHSAELIHRDIKPANIGVNPDDTVKILDFGYARPLDDNMTGELVSLWYGAPECALNWLDYNNTVDIWSVGCILGELLKGEPLFPGDNSLQQLNTMIEMLGMPSPDLVAKMNEESSQKYLEELSELDYPSFDDDFADADPLAVDLLRKMLDWDPETRITASEALQHPYFEQFHGTYEDESAGVFERGCEDEQKTVEEWKELIYNELVNYMPPDYYNEI